MLLLIALAALGAPQLQAWPQEASLPTLVWADFDGDGHEDALALHAGALSLFRGAAAGLADECAAEVGLTSLPPLSAAGWIDYDDDGAPDLFLVAADGEGFLLRNEGGEAFVDVTHAAGLGGSAPILHAEWGDVDEGQGLDLVLWTPERVLVHWNQGDGTFATTELDLASAPGFVGSLPWADRTAAEAEALGGPAGTGGSGVGPGRSGGSRGLPPAPGAAIGGAPTPVATIGGFTSTRFLGPLVTANGCAKSVLDQTTKSCIRADTTPTLGSLYPMTTELNVSPFNGRVGVNTTSPNGQFHVEAATGTSALYAASTARAASLFSTSTSVPALQVESEGYAGFFDGRVEVGYSISPPFNIPVPRVVMDTSTNAGRFQMYDSSGTRTVLLRTEEGAGNGAQLDLHNAAGFPTVSIDADILNGAEFSMHHENFLETVEILAAESPTNGAQLSLGAATGLMTFVVDAQAGSTASNLQMYSMAGVSTIEIAAEEVSGDGAQIILRKGDGTASIILDAEQGANARITTETLEITGGADLVESFDTGGDTYDPGTVLVIDSLRPGELTTSTTPYDRRVAGVVSGAGDVRPGLLLGQAGAMTGVTPVALTGRVYVQASAENGSIEPGDLLTTSATAGHAMRATAPERSNGAVLGKAMTGLESGTGLVLVLVNLQ